MRVMILLGLLLGTTAVAAARVPKLTLTGELRDAVGNLVEGTVTLTVRLYDQDGASFLADCNANTGPGCFHNELLTDVPVKKGQLHLTLGTNRPLDMAKVIRFARDGGEATIFVGIQVLGEGEMFPRMRLTSAPWALSVDWEGVTSKPALFSGDYGALTGIPASFPSDWATLRNQPATFPSDWATLLSKPATFPADWTNLLNKPATFPADWTNLANKPATFPSDWTTMINRPTFTFDGGGGGPIDWNNIVNRPATFPPDTHGHLGSDITGTVPSAAAVPWTGVSGKPATFPPAAHGHPGTDITGAVANATTAANVPWTGVSAKPATFPPSAHGHPGTDITGTVASATTAASVPWTGVSGKPASFPPDPHGHPGTDITGAVASATNATNATNAANVPWTGVSGKPAEFTPVSTSGYYIQNQVAADQAANLRVSGTASFLSGELTISAGARVLGSNSSGNLHLDSNPTGWTYLNWHSGRGVRVGNGASAGPVVDIDTAGNLTANGTLTGASSGTGVALRVGNDAELADVNLANTARLRGLQDGNQGILELGNGGTRITNGVGSESWINSSLNVGFGAGVAQNFGLTVVGPANRQARFGAATPLYINAPDAAVGFNLYYDAGWRFGVGNGTNGATYGGFLAYARAGTPALVMGMSTLADTGGPGTIGTIQQTLRVYQTDRITIGAAAVYDATKLINTSANGAHLTNTGQWNPGSSRTFKQEIVPLERPLSVLEKVRVVSYRYRKDNGDDGKRHIGVIAEELPDELATVDRKSVSTLELTALSLGASQALGAQLKQLQSENQQQLKLIRALEARLQALERRGQ